MPISVRVLPQYTFLVPIKIQQSLNGLAKLVPLIFMGAVLFPSVSTASNLHRQQNRASSQATVVSQAFAAERVITPGEARLMTQELSGLIDRFKATLLTIDA
ncbi:MAG: hypothetical protein AAFQ23_13170, partial [Cyanobacteria bacterium J06623_1]